MVPLVKPSPDRSELRIATTPNVAFFAPTFLQLTPFTARAVSDSCLRISSCPTPETAACRRLQSPLCDRSREHIQATVRRGSRDRSDEDRMGRDAGLLLLARSL